MTVSPRPGGQINNERWSDLNTELEEKKNSKRDRRKPRETSGGCDEFGQVPMISCTTQKEGEMCLVFMF